MSNSERMRHYFYIARKCALYGVIIGATIGSVIGCNSVPKETYDSEYNKPGCVSGPYDTYTCHYRPLTQSESDEKSSKGFFGGAAVGAFAGLQLAWFPAIPGFWYLLLVMLGQVSDAARGHKPSRHQVRVRFDEESEHEEND